MKKKVVAAFDAGGSNARVVVSGLDGKLLKRNDVITSGISGKDYPVFIGDAILKTLSEAGTGLDLAQIAGSQAGYCDTAHGVIALSPNLVGGRNIPMGDYLISRLNAPFSLYNDGNSAAYGILKFDHNAKDMKNLIYIIMGSGIGGGIVIKGEVYTGAVGYAGEIGHIVLDPDGPLCGCTQYGCWESFSSGTGIAKRAKEGVYQGVTSSLQRKDIESLTSKEVFRAAKSGDKFAKEILSMAGKYNSQAIINLVNIFDPQAIFFGESVAVNNPDEVLGPIREGLGSRLDKLSAPKLYITKVEEPGLKGAISLAISNYHNTRA